MPPEESTRQLFRQPVFSSALQQLADRRGRQMQLARHLTATDSQILNRQGTYDPRARAIVLCLPVLHTSVGTKPNFSATASISVGGADG
jgi:hypothetical protein